MIPGAWESRRQSTAAPVEVVAVVADSRVREVSQPVAQRAELPGWVKASIFAATLLGAMWLVMFLQGSTK